MESVKIIERDDVRTQVHEVILSILPALRQEGIDESLHLKELGADSIDRVEIIMCLLHQFNVHHPMSIFSEVANVAELIILMEKLSGPAQ